MIHSKEKLIINPISIEVVKTKVLVGKCLKMSLSTDKTSQLWQQFMQQKHCITSMIGSDLFSVEYFPCPIQEMTPSTLFDKWAAVEVSDNSDVPEGLATLTINSGLYAVFIHQGSADLFMQTLNAIFTQWLPTSGYQYDCRPQFEVMKADYQPNDPLATEEIWIPIIKK